MGSTLAGGYGGRKRQILKWLISMTFLVWFADNQLQLEHLVT
jgi:hypothetical protein